MTFMMSWVTQLVILRPPEAPTASFVPSESSTSAGVMLLSGYFPGMIELTLPGTGSNHIMPLFITTPVLFGTMPEPNPAMIGVRKGDGVSVGIHRAEVRGAGIEGRGAGFEYLFGTSTFVGPRVSRLDSCRVYPSEIDSRFASWV